MKLETFINSPYIKNEYDAVALSKTKSELKAKLMYLYNDDEVRVKERLHDLIDEYESKVEQIEDAREAHKWEDEIHESIRCKILCTRTLKLFNK